MPTPARTPGPLTPTTVAAIRTLADDATRHDGVAPLSEQPLLWLTDPASSVVHLLVGDATADHPLLGYAQVDLAVPGTVSAELVVAPAARRHGIGTALLAAVVHEAEEHAPDAPAGRLPAATMPHRTVQVWAHGDLPAARHLAASARMTVVRELWQMRLDLTVGTAIAEPEL
ncbi:MAG: GNAT family N-acetyltransferase, partial [Cellulomonas sp.]